MRRLGCRDRGRFVVSLALAAGVHAAIVRGFAQLPHRTKPTPSPAATQWFEIDDAPEEPPVAAAPPRTAPPRLPPEPPAPARRERASAARSAPRAASEPLAEAAAVLAKPSDADEALDFTTGPAPAYVGGATVGSAAGAKPEVPATQGSSAGRGVQRAPSGLDRSRHVSIVGSLDWSCPFPPAADVDRVDAAVVSLRISVDAQGRLQSTSVLRDPGHGFRAAAISCARAKQYAPALDRDARPVAAGAVVHVRFVR